MIASASEFSASKEMIGVEPASASTFARGS